LIKDLTIGFPLSFKLRTTSHILSFRWIFCYTLLR